MVRKFEFEELKLKGAYKINPFYAMDERGNLIKDYNIDTFHDAGINYELKETFYTYTKKGAIRAIHFQEIKPQPKLMRLISGHLFYIMVDLRIDSPTCGKWLHFDLKGDEPVSLLVPAGFGQGYLALEDSVMSYKASEVFYGPGDFGIKYDDPDIDIDWPFELIGGKENLIISEKDLRLMSFKEYLEQIERNHS